MGERRISFDKNKSEIIKRLSASEDPPGPFRLIADTLVFAAALGMKRNRRIPLGSSQAEPIRQEVFDTRGYDTMMNLIALHADQRPSVLADSDEATNQRATAFEEFANGGLEILQEELRGALNTLETVLLLINSERARESAAVGPFDLAELVE